MSNCWSVGTTSIVASLTSSPSARLITPPVWKDCRGIYEQGDERYHHGYLRGGDCLFHGGRSRARCRSRKRNHHLLQPVLKSNAVTVGMPISHSPCLRKARRG